ncbi:serine hydrolase [Rhodanobacter sp. B05]|uniref:serine hydrolase n=1 Tax=Rhodanobacter sp. B05 TaxID=1945859 RepID=UPI001C2CBC73|nr:serine hydrolase [Rhodanobacter sp. B05]
MNQETACRVARRRRTATRWLMSGWIALALLPCAFAAEQVPPAAASPALDAFAHRAMQTFDTPGMAVVVVDGDTIATHGYGVRKLGAPAKVDAHTIFPIGSNTKAFTAAALAILVDEGKLHWNDRVVDKLPGFRMYDAYASNEMTVIDLLVHRSGLGLGEGDLMIFPTSDRSRAELVHDIRFLKPAHSFRANYDYDNVLYIVAGQLVEAVSGQRWEEFVQQHILDPLGMHDTRVSIDARVADQASLHAKNATAVRGVGKQQVLTTVMTGSVFAPAGALQVSAADMGRWLQLQLRHGALDDGKRVFSEAASKALWTPQTLIPIRQAPTPIALAQPQFSAYALGLEVQDYRGHKIVTHLGGVLGGISAVVIIPEKHAAFAIMVNSEDVGTLFAMREHLLDSLLGLPSPDWVASYKQVFDQVDAGAVAALKASKAATHPDSGPSLPLSGYAGVYRDSWYGTATISQGKKGTGGLNISFDRTPGLHGTLEHVQYDTFRTHWAMPDVEDAYVTFALNPDGSVDRMTMKAISPTADFSWDYQDLHFVPVADGK